MNHQELLNAANHYDELRSSTETAVDQKEQLITLPVVGELKRAGISVADQRIASGLGEIAHTGTNVDFDHIEDRISELTAKEALVEQLEEKPNERWLEHLLETVPEAEEKLTQLKSSIDSRREADKKSRLNPEEAAELEELRIADQMFDTPITVPGAFEAIYSHLSEVTEYEDIFPREEIDHTTAEATRRTLNTINKDLELGTKIFDYLKEQPVLKTIQMEDFIPLLDPDAVRAARQQQLAYLKSNGGSGNINGLIRSRLLHYFRDNTPSGSSLAEELSSVGLVIQRGTRREVGKGGTGLVVIRLVGADDVDNKTIMSVNKTKKYEDTWDTPDLSFIEQAKENAPVKETESQTVDAASIAIDAIKKRVQMPRMRKQAIAYLIEHQNEIVPASDVIAELLKDADTAEYYANTTYGIATPATILLNPNQNSGKVTAQDLIERGLVVERGVITDPNDDRRFNPQRVYRLKSASSDQPTYPYDENNSDEQVVTWENTIGTYVEKSLEQQIKEEKATQEKATKDQQTAETKEPEIDPVLELRVRVFHIVNWLSEQGVLATTHKPESLVNVQPQMIPVNGNGDVSVKKLMRDLKKSGTIEDDREYTTEQLVLGALLPHYQEVITGDEAPEKQRIKNIVHTLLHDYYKQRQKLKRDSVRRRTR